MTGSKKWVLAFVLVAIVLPVGILTAIVVGLPRQSSITLTPDSFQPVRLNGIQFKVFDGTTGVLVGTIDGSSNVKYFLDPTHKYPKVDVFYSQPYITDAFGSPTTPTHSPTSKLITGGKAYFLTTYYMAIDVGARTYANLPTPKDTTTFLSPWKGFTYNYVDSVFGNLGSITLGINSGDTHTAGELDGELCVFMDTGVSPWTPTYGGGVAKITAAIEPVDYQLTTWNQPVRAGYSLEEAVTKIKTGYGNNPVIVQPSIDLQALTNYITYSYTQQGVLPNGTQATISVDTTSAKVAFADVYTSQVDQFGFVGLIQNTFSSQFQKINMPTTTPNEGPASQITTDQRNLFVRDVTIRGWVKNLVDANERVITGGAAPHGFSSNMTTSNLQINLADYSKTNLPTNLRITPEYSIQPKTTIKIARTEVAFSAWFNDGSIVGSITTRDDKYIKDPVVIQYPYAVNIENVYAASRIVYKLQIITENEIGIIMANGKPVDPTRLVDFDLTSIIRDPKQDEMTTGITRSGLDWQNIITIGIFIVVGVVVVGTIFFFMSLKGKLPGGQQSQKKTKKKISVGTKGLEYESSSE